MLSSRIPTSTCSYRRPSSTSGSALRRTEELVAPAEIEEGFLTPQTPFEMTGYVIGQVLFDGVAVGVDFVDFANIEFADSRFHLAHIADYQPD